MNIVLWSYLPFLLWDASAGNLGIHVCRYFRPFLLGEIWLFTGAPIVVFII